MFRLSADAELGGCMPIPLETQHFRRSERAPGMKYVSAVVEKHAKDQTRFVFNSFANVTLGGALVTATKVMLSIRAP